MKKRLLKIALATMLFSSSVQAQVTLPFIGCPATVMVGRPGTNSYANDPVSFYNLNIFSGSTTIFPGGPLKDPNNPTQNMDINGMGLNLSDNFIYGMSTASPTPKFYRAGRNYSSEQVGVVVAPAPESPANYGIVNPAAGGFDESGNYYFSALTGTASFFPAVSFTPRDFYIGKISNVASLASGTASIMPVYTKLNVSAMACGEFYSTLQAAISVSGAQNTGLRDLLFNPFDAKLYTYASFEYPAGSGVFKGQLLRVNTATGAVECYASTVLPFASATNEVAGTSMTPTGEILILFTNGAIYKTVMSAPGTFTGAISFLGNSGVAGGLRGDLASCVSAGTVVPVQFVNVSASEKNCIVTVNWKTAQEQNINRYEVEMMDATGGFTTAAQKTATNGSAENTYAVSLPVTGKTITARIKQIGNDGSISYSDIARLTTDCEKIKMFTVLNSGSVTDGLRIQSNGLSLANEYSVSIFNSYGALMLRKNFGAASGGIINIPSGQLSAGVYIVTLQSRNGEKFTERFIKN